ncbi:hypothetical protein ACQZ4Y_31285 [Rhizobium sp. L80/93]|uniref:hypothetical protein n=1 Tax=unclassified Rhizobium TaxID=2613769 RepID=UPI001ADA13FD|nr:MULTISPECIES: hypothetical protein [unclassified Rhizobium]MBO9135350.1 hypothetical protein [Rhizobium sp. B209b/85]MBO9171578.1 hypothetical protein [Rhizobium sp. L245/93]MBO9186677.1 hypothetical protein [Rhizobium sp. E27B/91]QXZ98845.1 hypothetical protein J5289_20145 [Rhizobium sp. B230/85]
MTETCIIANTGWRLALPSAMGVTYLAAMSNRTVAIVRIDHGVQEAVDIDGARLNIAQGPPGGSWTLFAVSSFAPLPISK